MPSTPLARVLPLVLPLVMTAAVREARADSLPDRTPICSLRVLPGAGVDTAGPVQSADAPAPSVALPVLPANAPALVLFGQNYNGAQLRDPRVLFGAADGEASPLALVADPRSAHLVALLPAPLVAGTTYEASANGTCSGQTGPSTVRFRATAPVPLPTTIGEVSVGPQADGGGGDLPNVTPVTVTLSRELAAFRSVSMFELRANGEPWLTLDYEALPNPTTWNLRRDGLMGYKPCGRSVCGGSRDADTQVTFELRAHVAGATTDPAAVTFEAPIDCESTVSCGEGNDPTVLGCHVSASPAGDEGDRRWPWLSFGAVFAALARAGLRRRTVR